MAEWRLPSEPTRAMVEAGAKASWHGSSELEIIDIFEAMLSAAPPPPDVADMRDVWRPIETAPKDGTRIDLLYPYPRGRTINCYWMGELGFGWVWREPTWEKGELLPEDKWSICNRPNSEPTHWMPVPDPPAALRQKEGA